MIKSIIKSNRNDRQTFNPQTDKIKNEKKKKRKGGGKLREK